MALEDLVQYIHDQTSKINGNPGCFTDSGPNWAALKESLWGKGLTSSTLPPSVVQKLASSEDGEPLPDVAPTTHPVVEVPESMPHVWGLMNKQILVRSEYVEALEAVFLANAADADAFLVTGQPGIGKSVFLIWLLMLRLALRLPTGLQTEETTVLLFHEGGVSEFQHIDDPSYFEGLFPTSGPAGRIWILVDSNDRLFKPAPIFRMCGGPFFVVEAVSACQKRKDWTTRLLADLWYMKIWSFAEVLQLHPFLRSPAGRCTQQQLWYLYTTYGASTRALVLHARNPELYEALLRNQVQQMNSEALRHAFQSPEADESSHLIMVIDPLPDSRRRCTKRIASRPVFEILWERHLKLRLSE